MVNDLGTIADSEKATSDGQRRVADEVRRLLEQYPSPLLIPPKVTYYGRVIDSHCQS